MVEQILSKYLTNIEHVWCVVVLHCFVSSRAQCPIWSHDDVDGANGRFQANLEDLEAECLTNVPYLSIPRDKLQPMFLCLSGWCRMCYGTTWHQRAKVCILQLFYYFSHKSSKSSRKPADLASGRETPGGTSGAPQVLHSSREFQRTSWTHAKHR